MILDDNLSDKSEGTFAVNDAKIITEPEQDPIINNYAAEVCFNNVPIKFRNYSEFTANVKTYYCEDKPFEISVYTYATESIKRPWGEVERQQKKQLFNCVLSIVDNFQAPRFKSPFVFYFTPNPDLDIPEFVFSESCADKVKKERLEYSKLTP